MCGPNCAAEAPATYLLYMYDMYMTPPPTPRLAYGRSSKGVEKWFHFYGHVCARCAIFHTKSDCSIGKLEEMGPISCGI